jgi:PQQ-dependent dehydrogenase (methanol/ethanol family)
VRVFQFIAVTGLAFVCALVPARAEKRLALVIGNDRYVNLPLSEQLQKAVSDSRAIGGALRSIGFDVLSGENLGRGALLGKFDELIQRVTPGDTAFFFFSGHGVALDGVNYILPADVPNVVAGQDIRLKGEALGEQSIVSELVAHGARVAVVVLDACRTNPFSRPGGKGVGGARGLAPPPQVQGVFSFYAASSGQEALDRLYDGDPNPNSVFTRVLAPALTKPGVDLATLALDVREEVARIAQTAGHTQRPAYYDETIGGRVYLAGLPPAREHLSAAPDAAQAWAAVQSTTSLAMLEEFLRQYGSAPFYGQLARARRDELAREQAKGPAKPADLQQTAAVARPEKPAVPADDPCSGPVTASSQTRRCGDTSTTVQPPDQSSPTKSWTMPTGNYANQRYSPLKQITTGNVRNLRVAWSFTTGTLRGHEGGPLVVGDVMYVHTPWPNNIYALDLKNDGRILWSYKPAQDPKTIVVMCCDTVNRGLSYADDKIFLSQADTTLVAIDARTGRVVWSVTNGDPSKGETSTGAPHVFKDKVVIGNAGGEFGVRGSVTAYDVKTGRRAWRGYSTGPDSDTLIDRGKTTNLGRPVGPNSGLNTWQGDQWKIGGGITPGWYAYDPDLNLMYYGTGNPSTWNPKQRPGDNKWSATIFARDVDTGMAKWVYQMTPHDEWDFDGTGEMILTDQILGGQPRKLLTHFDKNGLAYTLDRVTGELLVAEKFDPKVNWTTGVDMSKSSPTYGRPRVMRQYSPDANGEDVNTRNICPSSMGTKGPPPAAFSPDTGLFYVPTAHLCMDYEPFRVSYTTGQPYVGAMLSMFPPAGDTKMGNFIAWDGVTGKIVWSDSEQFAVWSGALATAGGVVFYGTLEGYLKAVDAKTGKELYKYKTASGIVGNVMTYERGGKQYVAVLSGVGGWPGIGLAAGLTRPTDGLGAVGAFAALSQYTSLGGQVTVFALPSPQLE